MKQTAMRIKLQIIKKSNLEAMEKYFFVQLRIAKNSNFDLSNISPKTVKTLKQ
jgi:hypothetical protein